MCNKKKQLPQKTSAKESHYTQKPVMFVVIVC